MVRGLQRVKAFRKKNVLFKKLSLIYLEKHQSYIPVYCKIKGDIEFPHLTGVHIAGGTEIGHGCVIFQYVTLGSNYLKETSKPGAPKIGNNVFIGSGVRIIGGVTIGDNVKIGAGCVITKDIPSNCTVVMDKPRIIFKDGQSRIL